VNVSIDEVEAELRSLTQPLQYKPLYKNLVPDNVQGSELIQDLVNYIHWMKKERCIVNSEHYRWLEQVELLFHQAGVFNEFLSWYEVDDATEGKINLDRYFAAHDRSLLEDFDERLRIGREM